MVNVCMIESLRVLKACRKTAVAARRVALQMIHNTVVCAPDELRDTLRKLTRMELIRTLAAWRPDMTDYRNVASAYRIALKSLARRYLELHDEIADLDAMIAAIVDELAPALVTRNSIGHASAAQLLLTAGDNSERLHSEASFAALCGVSPVPASSGKTTRHRLNRGGDRAANSALHIIAIGRLRTDPAPRAISQSVSPRAIPSSRPFGASSATSRERSSPSSGKEDRRSIGRRSPLDKQKGIRGVQYACGDYRRLLEANGIKASMSRKGNCLDNAPMESFFGALKTELVHRTRFRTRRGAKAALFEYIEFFYNRQRRHSSVGYRTPAQARIDMTMANAA